MTAKYCLDTAIWRDLHEDRKDRYKDLGELALALFLKIRLNQGKILYSDLVIDELSRAYDKKIIKNLFKNVSDVLVKAEINEKQVKEAANLSQNLKIPFGDALHGVVARDNRAVLVTRDRHFKKLGDQIVIIKPEDLS